MREAKQTRETPARRPYKRPRLIRYGTIVELTRASAHSGTIFDSDVGSPMMPIDFFKSA